MKKGGFVGITSVQLSHSSDKSFGDFSQTTKAVCLVDFAKGLAEQIGYLGDIPYLKAENPYLIHEMIKGGCTLEELEKVLESKEARESLKYCDASGSVPLLLALHRYDGFPLAKKILSIKEGRETLAVKDVYGTSAGFVMMEVDKAGFFKDDLFGTVDGLKCIETIPENQEPSLLDCAIYYSNKFYIDEILKKDSARKLLPQALISAIYNFWDPSTDTEIIEKLLEHKECRDRLGRKDEEGNTLLHEVIQLNISLDVVPILLKHSEAQNVVLEKNNQGLDVEEIAYLVQSSDALGKYQTRSEEELKDSVLSNSFLRKKFIKLFLNNESLNLPLTDRIFYAEYLKRMLTLDQSKPFLSELRTSLDAVENIRNLTHGDKIEIPLPGKTIVYRPQTLDHAVYVEVTTRENGSHDLTLIDKSFFRGTVIIQGISKDEAIMILNKFNSFDFMTNIYFNLEGLFSQLPSLCDYDYLEKIESKRIDDDKSIYKDSKLIIIPMSHQKTGNCSVKSISALIYNKFISRFYEENSKVYVDKTSYMKMKSLLIDLMIEDLDSGKLGTEDFSALKKSLVKKKESICKRLLEAKKD